MLQDFFSTFVEALDLPRGGLNLLASEVQLTKFRDDIRSDVL
jgi:hypothetical protein